MDTISSETIFPDLLVGWGFIFS